MQELASGMRICLPFVITDAIIPALSASPIRDVPDLQ